jgi:GTPase
VSEIANKNTRAGYVALIGAPNAGKSTLVNQLVGAKVSIVTHKIQTTRAIIRGILSVEDSQIVFVDTPGIFAPRRRLDKAMVTTAWIGARDADFVAVLVDAERGLKPDIETIVAKAAALPQAKALLLNKIDAVPRQSLLALAEAVNRLGAFDATFMISALNGDGCGDFVDWIRERLPHGPWLFPDEDISDLSLRQLAADITREKLFLRLHDELPYASHVETEAWTEQANGSVRIDQVVYVERESQKKIVIGKAGATIKAISTASRGEISQVLGRPAHLFLFVKVRQNWSDDPDRLREIGLDMSTGRRNG